MKLKVGDKVICTRKDFCWRNVPGVILEIKRDIYKIMFGKDEYRWTFYDSYDNDWNIKYIKLANKWIKL